MLNRIRLAASNPQVIAQAFFCLVILAWARPTQAQVFGCTQQTPNPIVCENSKPGNPPSDWDLPGYGDQIGDSSIQGFATDISANQGGTIHFKVNTTAAAYHIDIYRIGYYQGLGARFIATIQPSVTLPQTQPPCLTDASTGLIDCGNWAESASWAVPSNATSGLYVAKLVRSDTGGANHMVFVVRADSSTSQILFQTSDTTWEAYNDYGGNSLYVGNGSVGRAYKVSYNRPYVTRLRNPLSWFLYGEYPMIRWLESNGYDMSYSTGLDSDRNGGPILNHKAFLSVGHDEYWSGNQRANVEAARDAG
ncbi:MAG: N,N-dimethylformamidase beta subunit family domain-containing protein, partial [Candidatus Acidiferrales bacterium]